MSLYDYLAKPDWIRKNHYLTRAFSTTPLYLVSKIIGAVFAVMVVYGIGPEQVISADTGATIVDLCGTLFSIVIAFSFIIPDRLWNYGIFRCDRKTGRTSVIPCTGACIGRPDRIMVWGIQRGRNPDT